MKRKLLRLPGALWMVLALMVPVVWVQAAGSSSSPGPGSVYEGLVRRPADDVACPNLFQVPTEAGGYVCTHGPDPAPPGHDHSVPRPLVTDRGTGTGPGGGGATTNGLIFSDPPGAGPTAPAGAPGIGCFGDGVSGNRVQAIYAYPAGQRDRFDEVLPSIRVWAAETDAVFSSSATQTGGIRHVRWVTKSNCELDVVKVRLSALGAESLETTELELAAQGFNRADRKYLVWMDASVLCGIAGYYTDSAPGPTNLNNGNVPGLVARVDSGCWGLGSQGMSVEAHELMHSLGAVLPTAPHATLFGHCEDTSDRMCYDDGGLLTTLFAACASANEARFDCRGDDYFNTAPKPGTYLATNWNTANSSFLAANVLLPAISAGDATVSEGNTGTRVLSVPVSIAAGAPGNVTVTYTTADGTAGAAADYEPASGTLTFRPGETSKTIDVVIRGDSDSEPDETFFVNLSKGSNGVVFKGQGVATIVDDDPRGQSYWLVAQDGGIFAFGDARFFGSTGGVALNQPITGMAVRPTAEGYWFVARDGGVFAFGDAGFKGSAADEGLRSIVGMAATPSGEGYYFASSEGRVFARGDAVAAGGAEGAGGTSQPIVAMAASPAGGYWLAGRDGGVVARGGAPALGGVGGLNKPIVGIAATSTGKGYWLVATDGGIFSFGDAAFAGSTGDVALNQPIVGMAPAPAGNGYWLVARDGGIFAFGTAKFWGSTGNVKLNQPVVGMGASR